MQRKHLRFGTGFKVLLSTQRAQAAQMTIAPGGSEGGPGNRHAGADQWLYVVAGRGTARIASRVHPLRAGSLLLIEHGERHEIRNTARGPLKTLNFYTPPAYTAAGNELPAGGSSGRRAR
jgi:mannose-6-phosphate isomerase-like protein (cupin superfamily)